MALRPIETQPDAWDGDGPAVRLGHALVSVIAPAALAGDLG